MENPKNSEEKKSVPAPFCPQISSRLPHAQTLTSAEWSRPLTSWDRAQLKPVATATDYNFLLSTSKARVLNITLVQTAILHRFCHTVHKHRFVRRCENVLLCWNWRKPIYFPALEAVFLKLQQMAGGAFHRYKFSWQVRKGLARLWIQVREGYAHALKRHIIHVISSNGVMGGNDVITQAQTVMWNSVVILISWRWISSQFAITNYRTFISKISISLKWRNVHEIFHENTFSPSRFIRCIQT